MERHQKEKVERIDDEAIVLDLRGVFPRRVIVVDAERPVAEYRIVRTKTGGFCMNK
jgi:hypothetical protein